MNRTFARTVMMSLVASLAACGPELATDEGESVGYEDSEKELQADLKPLNGVELSEVGCSTTYTLSNGTPRTGLSATAEAWSCIYSLYVPAGATNLKFETTGGTGDADLFVKFGSSPTSLSYDCKSAGGTSAEICNISTIQAGTYYVRLYGYSASSGVTLTGSYTAGPPPPTSCSYTYTLSNGSTRTDVSAGNQVWSCIYTLYVPASTASVTFQTSGGTGNADMFVKFGSTPTDTAYDCRSSNYNSTETCSITNVQAGTYYVRLYGSSASSGISLTGSYVSTPPPPSSCTTTYVLSNGSTRTGLSTAEGYWSCIYTLSVPAGATNLKFETTGGTGDADLFVKFGTLPTDSSYDCKSAGGSSEETCNITTAQAGTYYVRMYGYRASSGISLKGSYIAGTPPPTSCSTTYSLSNGSPRTGISAGEKVWSCIYTLYVPASATSLKFETTGATGDADLFVKFGSTPTDSSYDCKSEAGGSAETCTISNLQAGTYYVRLFGYHAASSVTLTGQYN